MNFNMWFLKPIFTSKNCSSLLELIWISTLRNLRNRASFLLVSEFSWMIDNSLIVSLLRGISNDCLNRLKREHFQLSFVEQIVIVRYILDHASFFQLKFANVFGLIDHITFILSNAGGWPSVENLVNQTSQNPVLIKSYLILFLLTLLLVESAINLIVSLPGSC